jgi:AraC family transcriptional regulator
MSSGFDGAIARVIAAMYERVGEELTIDDLARTAMYSKFHFSRGFRDATGVSPGRFLSVLRFQEAKRLLATTSMSVAEISNKVGYSSLGTFSTRFKLLVGVSPTEYRRHGGRSAPERPWRRLAAGAGTQSVTLRGHIHANGVGACGETFVGVFPHAIPDSPPVASTVLSGPGPFALTGVPEGTWHLVVHSVRCDRSATGSLASGGTGSVGHRGPFPVRGRDFPAGSVAVHLRPMVAVDLPVLPAPFVIRPSDVSQHGTAIDGGQGERCGGTRHLRR